jgi:hypothetical protein
MSNKIILKKSSVVSKVPTPSDLEYGELAINYADEKLYFKNSDNTIKSFSTTGSSDENIYTRNQEYSVSNITEQTAIYSFSASVYRGAKYTFQVTNGSNYGIFDILVVHNGTSITANYQYAEYYFSETYTSSSSVIEIGNLNTEIAFDILGGNVRMLATPTSGTSSVKGMVTTIVV